MGETPLDEDEARKALELLVDAVAREVKPGVLELRLAVSTLRDLLDDPTPQAFALATRAFNAIDTETRRRIRSHAERAAVVYCTNTGRQVTVMEALAPPHDRPQASGFLQALNTGRCKPAPVAPPKPKR